MEIQIHIEDDFDLEKIAQSGQCFRVKRYDNGTYRFITGGNILYIHHQQRHQYAISCSHEEWQDIWTEYFDLARNYRSLRDRSSNKIEFIQKAMEYGRGLRVLHQEPWEMLITFIISQRKNIPAISKSVEALSRKYGCPIETDYEEIFTFPTPKELTKASIEELSACGLGYRTPYVQAGARQVASGNLDLKKIEQYDDEKLFQELKKVHGVGDKVANCVCLFGYGRAARVPVDVWIARAIEEECHGENPFPAFGDDAGIIQQYVFYYERSQPKKIDGTLFSGKGV